MIMNKNRPLFQNIQWQKLDTNSFICSNAAAESLEVYFFVFFYFFFFTFFKTQSYAFIGGDPDKKIWTSINFFFRILDSSKHKDKNEGLHFGFFKTQGQK